MDDPKQQSTSSRSPAANNGNNTSSRNNNNNNTSIAQEHQGIPVELNSAAGLLRNIPANSSFKDQKKSYHMKKRYFTRNIQGAIDSTQEIHSGWLKARTTFKRWTKVWCQVKPGYLIMYTTQEAQKKHRLGVVLLSVCQIIKRPTKKEGFCFKLINPFGCSVWAKSSTRALAFSQTSLTLRADVSIGKLWLDSLNRCNLSANLEGYRPVVDEASEAIEILKCNQSITSDSDDDDNSTRQLESIMHLSHHSDSTSNNNSLASSQINFQSAGSGKPFINGTALQVDKQTAGTFKSSQDGLAFKMDENENKSFHYLVTEPKTDRPSSQLGRNNNILNGNGDSKQLNKSIFEHETMKSASSSQSIGLNSNSTKMVAKFSKYSWQELQLENVNYVGDGVEELGSAGVQSEGVNDSNKSLFWHIIKQLRPGMDLSKVTLPTFILEPRSFLEKLADYYYHCDILSEAVAIDDPLLRLINIVKWYLSGFYKKPKGPKKPYNPILGERFRCFWDHPKTQSRTFFIAEQVSHHPPISAFHVTNRKDGYTITCALLSRSKFTGNSVSAILDGKAKLYLNKRNETYTLTMPHANCGGILLGSLCLELAGKVEIGCAETGCKAELDFKLAPVWGSANSYNYLTGKILKANKVTHTLEGNWDKKITITDKQTNERSVLWEVTDAIRSSRLKRYTVAMKDQGERESVKLWSKVTEALMLGDQNAATAEKTILEDMQRQEARDRKSTFAPEHFGQGPEMGEWSYRWNDSRSWDERRDIMQFEELFKIRTLMLSSNSPSKTRPASDPTMISNFDPIIDLPLTQLDKFSEQTEGPRVIGRQEPSSAIISRKSATQSKDQQQNSETPSSTPESKFDADFKLIKLAIKQVTENNRKLEQDVAILKRGKRKTVAFIIATMIVVLLSMFFKYFC